MSDSLRHSVTQASASGADDTSKYDVTLLLPPFSNTSISEWSTLGLDSVPCIIAPPFSNTSISEWSP